MTAQTTGIASSSFIQMTHGLEYLTCSRHCAQEVHWAVWGGVSYSPVVGLLSSLQQVSVQEHAGKGPSRAGMRARGQWWLGDEETAAWGLPWWLSGKESTCQCRRRGSIPDWERPHMLSSN